MNEERARSLIAAERQRVVDLLAAAHLSALDDEQAEHDVGDDDADAAQPLEHTTVDLAIEAGLDERLAALDRAEQRLSNGTFGLSVESGARIPDERLDADPAAELTVVEAERRNRADPEQRRSEGSAR
jgi:DnaK suppressor protein